MKRFILSIHIVLASILLQAQEKYDLVIVGGTPGGIMTAIAAAKEGKTSVILERSKHIGGLPAMVLVQQIFRQEERQLDYSANFWTIIINIIWINMVLIPSKLYCLKWIPL